MKKSGRFFFIPHSHWEGAVFKTREEYLEMGLPIILRALRLLQRYPEYRFVLDQACFVKPFVERYPEEVGTLKRMVAEKRLEICGGLWVMPDVNMPGGESFVRQIEMGKKWFRDVLGAEATIGWQVDTFGHHAQIPQLMRLAGFRSFWSQRGVPAEETPTEFVWEGLDGTRIPFFWMPKSYAIAYGSPATWPEFKQFMVDRYEQLGAYGCGPDRAAPAGADVCLPEEHIPEMIRRFNEEGTAPFEMCIGTPSDYEKAVERQMPQWPIVRGDMNPIFQGTYSSRIELKQRTRELERMLTAAEKLGAILEWHGGGATAERLEQAWEPMLFNQTHDLMSGVMTDHVYDDTIRLYEVSHQLAQDELDVRMRRTMDLTDTRGDGVAVWVFNPLSWPRTDVAQVNVGFSEPDVRGLKVVGPDGVSVSFQVLAAERSDDGALLRVKLAFVAREVPPLGHAVYRVLPQKMDLEVEGGEMPKGRLENERYLLDVDLAHGAIRSLLVKDGGWDALRAPGNVISMEEDRGDFWELYRPLGWGFVTNKDRHASPPSGACLLSTDGPTADAPAFRKGPVFSEITVAKAFGEAGRLETRVRLYQGLRRVEIQTKLLNNSRFVRYRAQFPTAIENGRVVREIPFGAVEQPEGIECPAQNWMDYGNGQHGVALLNRGIPGNNAADGTLLLSLMRTPRSWPTRIREDTRGRDRPRGSPWAGVSRSTMR